MSSNVAKVFNKFLAPCALHNYIARSLVTEVHLILKSWCDELSRVYVIYCDEISRVYGLFSEKVHQGG